MIPLELVTMLGSTIIGGIMSMIAKGQEARHSRELALIDRYKAEASERKSIRDNTNKAFSFTRRTIALVSILAIIVLPKVAAIFIPLDVIVGYHELHPGFWFFTDERDIVEWKTATGLVITPLDTHLVSAIVGLYFGNKVGR